MTDFEDAASSKIDTFVTSLSSINFVFAFAMNIFNFTILYLLIGAGISIIYGGIGISIGQAVLLFVVIPLGRLIDKGKSYALMSAGSILYSFILILLYFASSGNTAAMVALVTGLVAAVLIFQNMFKSSLSSFIAKSVKARIMGKSYSRIIWMETAGGTASFFLVYFARPYLSLRLLYLAVGLILLVVSILSYTVFAKKSRKSLKLEENRVKRPSFIESLKTLKRRGRFTVSLLSSKVLMSVGILGFSYFYLIIGQKTGVGISLSLLSLGLASAIGIIWGIWSERFVSSHPDWGKAYIVIMAVLDIVSYLMILIALEEGSRLLFLAAPIVGSPGPFLIPGALAYEVKVVGKENRGIFSGIQRTFTGIPGIVLGAPLAYVFTVNPIYMWSIIVASSIGTLAFSLLIPSRKYFEENYGLKDPAASQ